MRDYSQYGEQEAILAHTPEGGFVLDIGAFHPEDKSNSRALIERGSKAWLVDMGPSQIMSLARFYDGNPNVVVVQAAVSPLFDTLAVFNVTEDAVSSNDAGVVELWKWTVKYYGRLAVPLVPLARLLGWLPEHPAFINIDVEGSSAQIFRILMGMHPTGLRCVCVEHDGQAEDLKAIAERAGYRTVLENGTNLVVAR